MKKYIKILILLITLLSVENSFAGMRNYIEHIEQDYNGSLDNLPVNEKIKLKGYITKLGIYGVNLYNNYLLEDIETYNLPWSTPESSFGLFYPESDIETTKGNINYKGEQIYNRNLSSLYDYNKGLMLFGSKNFIKSLKYYDFRENTDTLGESIFNNGKFENTSNFETKTNPIANIIASADGNSLSPEGNIIIEGEIRDIDLTKKIFLCKNGSITENVFLGYPFHDLCLKYVNNLKSSYYKGYIGEDDFIEQFNQIWDTHIEKEVSIKTKIFILDKITVNGYTYGYDFPEYEITEEDKNALFSFKDKIDLLSQEKKEKIYEKIRFLPETFHYGTKNYKIFYNLEKLIKESLYKEKEDELKIILDTLRNKHYLIELFTEVLSKEQALEIFH